MKKVRIAELKAHLSEHLRAVRRGQELIVCDRDIPVARIVPYRAERKKLVVRPARGTFKDFRFASSPPEHPSDIVADLLEQRKDRF